MRLWPWRRRKAVDTGWWEDGLPVSERVHVLGPLGPIQRALRRRVCAAEFEMGRAFDRQMFGGRT